MTQRIQFLFLFAVLLLALGCEDDPPLIENEEELITSVTLTLFPDQAGGGETVVFGFSDPDGDGGNDPVMTMTGSLQANSVYQAQVSFAGPEGSIDSEILEEDVEHQVFYPTDSGLNLTFNYQDSDDNGDPLGLQTQVLTGDASSGSFRVILIHEPDKSVMALPSNPQAVGGETDVEVTFSTSIQ